MRHVPFVPDGPDFIGLSGVADPLPTVADTRPIHAVLVLRAAARIPCRASLCRQSGKQDICPCYVW